MNIQSKELLLFLFNNKDELEQEYLQDKNLMLMFLTALVFGLAFFIHFFNQIEAIPYLTYFYCLLFSVVGFALFFLCRSVYKLHRFVRMAKKLHSLVQADQLDKLTEHDLDKAFKSFKI